MLSKIRGISSLIQIMDMENSSATIRNNVGQIGDKPCILQNLMPFGHPFWDTLIVFEILFDKK